MNDSNMGDHWEIGVHLEDKFDFDKWRWEITKSNLANDLGLVMQNTYMLKTYRWEVDYTYNYKE